MSSIKINDSFHKTEKDLIQNEDEEELIIKYTDEIKNEETRWEAIENLYKYREKNKNIAIYLWYSRGTMAALVQEIIKAYQYLSASKLTNEKSDKIKFIISLFQNIVLHQKTRKEFIESQLLVFLYPFLKCTNKSKSYEVIKVSALSVIAALVKNNDSDVINFLIKTEIIPVILRIMEKGNELIRAVTCFIVQRIIVDVNGLKYICEMRQRLLAIIYVLDTMLQNKVSPRIVKNILKIYLRLIENKDAKKTLKTLLPEIIRDVDFKMNLEDSLKTKVNKLLKALDEDESGNDIKIKKLKNDLTNKNSNNNSNNNATIQNINIIKKNNFDNMNNLTNYKNTMNYNNSNNNSDNNNNSNKNLNMMFLNNMNQMKMNPAFMIPPSVGDFNYNIYNDNDNYMNTNIYNQNTNNGFSNMNFYSKFKNM